MGAAASIVAVTAEDVGQHVYNIGVKYQPYREVIVENGIDGHFLASVNEAGLRDVLKGLEITNTVHVMRLVTELSRLGSTANAANNNNAGSSTPTAAAGSADFENLAFRDHLVTVPRDLMSQLFKIQGTPCDPTDLAPTVAALARIIKQCISDSEAAGIPPKEYDCFLSYRVKADHHTAELLYAKLRDTDVGIKPFLDKQCLRTGEDWKMGFLRGLKSSSVFVALVSSDALAPVRDFEKDHTFDNVLLEYQMALEINDARKRAGKPEYIVPVLVAKEESEGRIKKFRDFDPSLYSDSITAQESPEEAERKHLALLEAEEQEHLRQLEENNRRAKVEAERLEKLKLEEELSRRVKIEVERLEKLKQEAQQLEPKLSSLEANKDVKGIVKVLSYGTAEGKTQAAGALWNIACNNAENKVRIANEGGIAPLIQLLRDGTAEGRTQAAAALRNMSSSVKDKVRAAGLSDIQAAHDKETDATAKAKMLDLLNKLT